MKKLFALAAAMLLSLSLLTGPIAQAYEDDPPPPPPVEEPDPDGGEKPEEPEKPDPDPDGGVLPAEHPPKEEEA